MTTILTARKRAYTVCKVARKYPASWFWLFACGALAAGVEQNLPILAAILFGQLALIAHTVHRMWSPPVWSQPPGQGERRGRHQ